ncbi:MAG: dimethylamine/trimethylamine dehydrogenase, partial [Parasphingorhabdus sp.]
KCAVALRFSVAEPSEDMGLRHDGEGREVVQMLAELPDLWDVNISTWSSDSATSRFREEGHQLEFVDFVKTITDKPVVGVGRFTSPDKMVSMIKQGKLDLIGAARPSIADPFLPVKIRDNRIEDIRECIGCNICVGADAYGIPLRCTQNPTIAEEWRRNWHPESVPAVSKSENLLVVGAGPAGLECALTLARAGHQVTISEGFVEAGGRVTTESKLAGLSAWYRVADYRLYQLSQMSNVSLYLESKLDYSGVEEFSADHVFIATGSHWRRDGIGGSHYQPIDLNTASSILTPDDIKPTNELKGRVLIYDDDHNYMGGVLANQLALWGCSVEIVTPLQMISAWTDNTLEQARVVQQLRHAGVKWHVNEMLASADQNSAKFHCAYTGELLAEREFDHLLLLGGRLPNDGLYKSLLENNQPATAIGDCLSPGIIQAAVHSGHRHARLHCGDKLAGDSFNRDQATLFI